MITSFYLKFLVLCAVFAEKPFERVPTLDVDGTEISESINIVRYLGMTFGK